MLLLNWRATAEMANFVEANYVRRVKMMLGLIKNSYTYFVRVMRSCVRD